MLKFKFISPHDPAYVKERLLRWEVLRKPLGMPPGSESFPQENNSLHLLAFDKKEVVGCVLFCPEDERKGQLYQMAISEEYQGRGFGRKIINHLENELLKKGVEHVSLEARGDSVSFYKQLGYQPVGDSFEKLGISHQHMEKSLQYE